MNESLQTLHLAFGARDWFDLFLHYLSLSLLSVGGAITTAPDMHRFLVDKQHWLTDAQFNATPAGWAIEYLREMGGLLGIELGDFAYAIEKGDADWVARFLKRFPALRHACDMHGRPFSTLAQESQNPEIQTLFREPSSPQG